MKRLIIFFILTTLVISCATAPTRKEQFGTVKVIKEKEVVDEKSGEISVETTVIEEKAEKSIVDKDAEALMTPQRYTNIATFFSHYSIGLDDTILTSIYNQEGDQGSDLWLFRGGSKVRLSNTSYHHNFPSFSRDGNFVYFASYRGKEVISKYGQDSYIWRMSSSGAGGITRIGTAAYKYLYPEESPNGQRILFTSQELHGNNDFIWYMQKNGALPTQLKQGTEAKWINNNKIVFTTKDDNSGLYTIWSCNTDGSMLTQIVSDREMDCIQPNPSPNGKYISYVKQNPKKPKPEETRDIYIYRFEDGLSQQITTNESRDDLPNWSPDGSHLYFRSSRGVGWNVWRLSTNFLLEETGTEAEAEAKVEIEVETEAKGKSEIMESL